MLVIVFPSLFLLVRYNSQKVHNSVYLIELHLWTIPIQYVLELYQQSALGSCIPFSFSSSVFDRGTGTVARVVESINLLFSRKRRSLRHELYVGYNGAIVPTVHSPEAIGGQQLVYWHAVFTFLYRSPV